MRRARVLPAPAILAALLALLLPGTGRAGDEHPARPYLEDGDRARQAGHAADAVALYEKALAADETDVEVYPRLGGALVEAGNYERAVKVLRRYVEIAPRDCRAHSGLATAYLKQGLADQAVKAFEEAIGLCPEDASAFEGLGAAHEASHDPQEALEAYRHATELNADDVSALRRLAELYYDRRLYPEAAAAYEALLARPDHGALDEAGVADAHEKLGMIYEWARVYDRSIPHWQARAASPASDGAAKERAQKHMADCRAAQTGTAGGTSAH